jgi:hypothetical protein
VLLLKIQQLGQVRRAGTTQSCRSRTREVFQRSRRAIAKLQDGALEEQQLLKDKTEQELRANLQREEEKILQGQSASKERDALAAQVESFERRLQQANKD